MQTINPIVERIIATILFMTFLIVCQIAVTGSIDERYNDNINAAEQAQQENP